MSTITTFRRSSPGARDAALGEPLHPLLVAVRQDRDVELLPQGLELVDRGRAVDVGGDEERAPVPLLERARELARRRRLPRSLEPGQDDHRRRLLRFRERRMRAAEELHQLVVDDLDHLLGGRDRRGDLLAARLLLDPRAEILRDLEVDVGLEQRAADLAHALGDHRLVEDPPAAKAREGAVQLGAELVEHRVP